MKQLRLVLLIASIFVVMLCVSGCGGLSESDQACVDSVKASLQAGFDNADKGYSNYGEYKDNLKAAVGAEIDAVAQIKDTAIENEELAPIIADYIKALDSKNEGVDFIYEDAKAFNEKYYDQGQTVQVDCINKLIENYGFAVDEDYQEALDKFLKNKVVRVLEAKEKVNVNTKCGEVGVSIDGYKYLTNAGDEKEGDLLCAVENINYADENNEGFVDVGNFVTVIDEEGYTIEFINEAYGDNIDGYHCSTGFEEMAKGEKKKLAVAYDQSKKMDMVKVLVGNKYECFLPVK